MSDDALIEQTSSCAKEIRTNLKLGKARKVEARMEELFALAAKASGDGRAKIQEVISSLAREIAEAEFTDDS